MREFDYECKQCGCEVTQFEFKENKGLCDTCIKKETAKTSYGDSITLNDGTTVTAKNLADLFGANDDSLKKARQLLFGKENKE